MSNGIQKQRDTLALLETARPQIAAILPEGVKVDQVIQMARAAFLTDPNVQRCSPGSIVQAVGAAASLGLVVGKSRNEAHLVPFGDVCTLIIDYRGILKLARRSGQILAIETRVVNEGDEFALVYTEAGPAWTHTPCLEGDPGREKLVYAYAHLRGGEKAFELMTREQVERVRNASKGKNSPAWRDHWGEMARKTVLRRLCKRLPQSVELAAAIEHLNATEGLEATATSVIVQPAKKRTLDTVRERLGLPVDPPAATAPDADYYAEPGSDDDPEQAGD